MKMKLLGLLTYFPFVLIASSGEIKLNGARILEGIIIAILAGLLSGYVAVKELKVQVQAIQTQVNFLQNEITTLDNRLYENRRNP